MTSSLRRVSNDFWNEVEKIYRKNKGMIPKTMITKQIASQMKAMGRKQPKYVVNYWPISTKKVRVY